MTRTYTGRLAPSPTGLLHLGHAATFWQAHQRAASGTLLLRIEDIDPQRSRSEFTEAIFEDLAWLNIHWAAPVLYQSRRIAAYRAAFDQLLTTGLVYPCHCSRRDLAAMLSAPHEGPHTDDEGVYPGTCRPGTCRPGTSNPANVFRPNTNYRFCVPTSEPISFEDLHLGPQAFTAGVDFGDFLVWRKDGLPSYQLACVVDDAATAITEVVRGRDLLLSTARQILLQRALGLATPAYFHTHLLTDAAGVRLAKRHDALSVRTLRQHGATPADIIARFTTPTA